MTDAIQAQTSVPLDRIVQATIYELQTGIYEAKRAYDDDAVKHFNRAEALLGLFNMEYNAITHNWPMVIDPTTKALIEQALALHQELLEMFSPTTIDNHPQAPV